VVIDTSKISKTTVNGFLSAGIAVVTALMVLPPKASALVIALAAMRALSGYLQADAGDDGGAK
jgi:hypothetical protein